MGEPNSSSVIVVSVASSGKTTTYSLTIANKFSTEREGLSVSFFIFQLLFFSFFQ
jgi:hypothetical protein